jgi:methionine--tRNA ligase beta chain
LWTGPFDGPSILFIAEETPVYRQAGFFGRIKYMISFEDFQKLDLKIGKIVAAENVDGADKLLKLEVDLGEEERRLVAGIAKFYQPENLIGREIVVVANLEPRNLMGIESQGMLLAADDDGRPVLLKPDEEVPPGTKIR